MKDSTAALPHFGLANRFALSKSLDRFKKPNGLGQFSGIFLRHPPNGGGFKSQKLGIVEKDRWNQLGSNCSDPSIVGAMPCRCLQAINITVSVFFFVFCFFFYIFFLLIIIILCCSRKEHNNCGWMVGTMKDRRPPPRNKRPRANDGYHGHCLALIGPLNQTHWVK